MDVTDLDILLRLVLLRNARLQLLQLLPVWDKTNDDQTCNHIMYYFLILPKKNIQLSSHMTSASLTYVTCQIKAIRNNHSSVIQREQESETKQNRPKVLVDFSSCVGDTPKISYRQQDSPKRLTAVTTLWQ